MRWIDDKYNWYMPFVPNIDNYEDIYDEYNWIKKDGTIICIKDMEDSHIEGCISMIKNRCIINKIHPYSYAVYRNLKSEMQLRGFTKIYGGVGLLKKAETKLDNMSQKEFEDMINNIEECGSIELKAQWFLVTHYDSERGYLDAKRFDSFSVAYNYYIDCNDGFYYKDGDYGKLYAYMDDRVGFVLIIDRK